MYGEVQGTTIVPPVVVAGTAAVLPTTGLDGIMSLALAVAAGLVTWAVVYFMRANRVKS